MNNVADSTYKHWAPHAHTRAISHIRSHFSVSRLHMNVVCTFHVEDLLGASIVHVHVRVIGRSRQHARRSAARQTSNERRPRAAHAAHAQLFTMLDFEGREGRLYANGVEFSIKGANWCAPASAQQVRFRARYSSSH